MAHARQNGKRLGRHNGGCRAAESGKLYRADVGKSEIARRGQNPIPFRARCITVKIVSPLKKGEIVEALRIAPEDACVADMLVLIRWQGRTMAVPLSQFAVVGPDASTAHAIADWHYRVAQS